MPQGIGYPPQTVTGQPAQGVPEQGVPLWERIRRLLPGMVTGKQTSDVRLPMEAFTERDPRLPAQSGFDAIRGAMEQVHDLGTPKDPAEDALLSIQRMAGSLKPKK